MIQPEDGQQTGSEVEQGEVEKLLEALANAERRLENTETLLADLKSDLACQKDWRVLTEITSHLDTPYCILIDLLVGKPDFSSQKIVEFLNHADAKTRFDNDWKEFEKVLVHELSILLGLGNPIIFQDKDDDYWKYLKEMISKTVYELSVATTPLSEHDKKQIFEKVVEVVKSVARDSAEQMSIWYSKKQER